MSIREIREALSGFREKFGLSTFAELNVADLADLLVRLNEMERVILHRIEVFLDERGEQTTPVFVEPGVTVEEVDLSTSARPEGKVPGSERCLKCAKWSVAGCLIRKTDPDIDGCEEFEPKATVGPKDYRKMLEEVGGWDNEMASVPAGGVREVVEGVESLRARVTQYETMMMSLPRFDQLRETMTRALREDREFLPTPTRHLFPCGTQQNDMVHTLIRLFARAVDLELARWRFASTVSSVRKYPREVVCLNCEEVVAYATINAIPQSPMLAAELIRPDGSYPEACDPGCLNCLPGGAFRLRDRVTGEWVGEPPPKEG